MMVAVFKKHKDHPRFLYLAFNAVHAPMHATDRYLARFPDIKDPLRQKMAAMHSAMDDNIGKVLARLRAEKLEEDTLINRKSETNPKHQIQSPKLPRSGRKEVRRPRLDSSGCGRSVHRADHFSPALPSTGFLISIGSQSFGTSGRPVTFFSQSPTRR